AGQVGGVAGGIDSRGGGRGRERDRPGEAAGRVKGDRRRRRVTGHERNSVRVGRKGEIRPLGRREEFVHVGRVLVVRCQGRQVPVRLDRGEDREVVVGGLRGVRRLYDGTDPDRVDGFAVALIERQQ